MQMPTFEEAARLWPNLSDRSRVEADYDEDLFATCEEVILGREIASPSDALLVVQVLLDNLQLGQRSDRLDVAALTSLRNWLAGVDEAARA